MSRKTMYACDRCKKKQPKEIQSFDFGKDYGVPKNAIGEFPNTIVDLCYPCWVELTRFLIGEKMKGEA